MSTHALLSTSAADRVQADERAWMPMAEGQWIRPLKLLPDLTGYVAQLKLQPGAVIPPHRHTGPVHAFNVEGSRRLHTGELVGPGEYVFEPAGQIDTWEAVGADPLVVLIHVVGDVEYLDANGDVAHRFNAAFIRDAYGRFCEVNGRPLPALEA